jgi:L-lactate dehydrogenase
MQHHALKISVIGAAGRVGSATAFALVMRGLAEELVLIDRTTDAVTGDAYDLRHAAAFVRPMDIRAGCLDASAGSDIIIVCASAPVSDTSSRLTQAAPNAALFRQIIPSVAAASPDTILLIVSNPVDVMTHVALRLSGFPPARVFGTGTLIDTARFRALLSHASGMNSDDIRAYIVGEHGDSQLPALSVASAGGVRFPEHDATVLELFEQARRGGYEVVAHKKYTNYAIAAATSVIVEAIARNTLSVLPVSVLVDGYLGVDDVCLSMPCVIGRAGVVRMLHIDLSPDEQEAFVRSAASLRGVTAAIGAQA